MKIMHAVQNVDALGSVPRKALRQQEVLGLGLFITDCYNSPVDIYRFPHLVRGCPVLRVVVRRVLDDRFEPITRNLGWKGNLVSYRTT